VPPALLKAATTGWRIIRYYTGNRAYRSAGPPPMLLRVLGPLVVLTTLAVLGTGLALVAVGPDAGRAPWFYVGGRLAVTVLVLHKATFVLWAVATGVHTLARLVSAVRQISSGRAVPGRVVRVAVLVLTGLVAIAAAVVVLRLSGAWINLPPPLHHRHG